MRAVIFDWGGVLDTAETSGLSAVMMGLVAQVRQAGLRTAVLSNAAAGELPPDAGSGMFDALVVSGEVGMRKPDERIYRHVARRLDVPPSECVFIDDVRGYVMAAVAVGMVGIVHRSYEATTLELEAVLDQPLR
jgi:putative hydrolase of the HAD superfamily